MSSETKPPTITEQISQFRSTYLMEHPKTTPEETRRAVDEHRQELIDADPGVQALKAKALAQQQRDAGQLAQAQYDQRQTAAGAAELERQKGITRAAYLSAGGSPDDFEREWPALKQRRLQERALAEVRRVEVEQARRVRGLING